MKCMICHEKAQWFIEVKGIRKIYLCDLHTDLLAPAIKDEFWYGQEQLNG